MILGEQFLHSCPRDLVLFIRERTPTDVSEMMELANVYTDSRLATGVKDKIVALPPRSDHPDWTPNPGNGQKVPPLACLASRCVVSCVMRLVTKLSSAVWVDHHATHSAPNPKHKDKGPVYASVCLTLPVDSVRNINAQPGDTEAGDFVLACCSVGQGIKGTRHKPDLKMRFWCVCIP